MRSSTRWTVIVTTVSNLFAIRRAHRQQTPCATGEPTSIRSRAAPCARGRTDASETMQTNTVTVVGNITREPELRFTARGRAVASLGIAVNRRYQINNEWQEQTWSR